MCRLDERSTWLRFIMSLSTRNTLLFSVFSILIGLSTILQPVSGSDSLLPLGSRDYLHQVKCSAYPLEDDEHIIECPSKTKIAINGAYFSTELKRNGHCKISNSVTSYSEIRTCYDDNVTMPINARCSGQQKCDFYLQDLMRDSDCISPGHIFINYTCVSEKLIEQSCNRIVKDKPFGYIASPAYPKHVFKVENACNWTVVGEEGQTVEVKLLDLDLPAPKLVKKESIFVKDESVCEDGLIIDSSMFCGQNKSSLRTFTSNGHSIHISLVQYVFRGVRGFLLQYQVKGCAKLKDPYKGHIVERNDSYALLTCCEEYVFKDTRQNQKQLTCLHNTWSGSVSECVSLKDFSTPVTNFKEEINSFPTLERNSAIEQNHTVEQVPKTLFSDIFIPVALMVIFAVIMVVVIVAVVKYRGRRKSPLLKNLEANVPLKQPTVV